MEQTAPGRAVEDAAADVMAQLSTGFVRHLMQVSYNDFAVPDGRREVQGRDIEDAMRVFLSGRTSTTRAGGVDASEADDPLATGSEQTSRGAESGAPSRGSECDDHYQP